MTTDPILLKKERAREELDKGKLGAAVGLLGDAVSGCRDPQVLLEMHQMAQEGLERSGRFSKGEWKRILKTLDRKLATASPQQAVGASQ